MDFVAAPLLRGRFAVLVNGNPNATMAPSNFTEQLKSPVVLDVANYFVAFEFFYFFHASESPTNLLSSPWSLEALHSLQLPYFTLFAVASPHSGQAQQSEES
ncbi:spore germination protein [Paenibacillus cremeus]|uniref:Spore germination protein n=1 Tax=Paenibacillus cremeus TaxID=2163881 RepID=A0A559K4V7_9BACL|nr:spore germination protein [Paenibacillus cremeus]